jgi:hypothetical protein
MQNEVMVREGAGVGQLLRRECVMMWMSRAAAVALVLMISG